METVWGKFWLKKITALVVALVLAFGLMVGVPVQALAVDASITAAQTEVTTQAPHAVKPAAVLKPAAIKVPTTKNYKTLTKNLTKRFAKGGKSAALNNSSIDAAVALSLLGKKAKIDAAAAKAQYDAGVGFYGFKSAGAVAKYAIIMKLAGKTAQAKAYMKEVESLMTTSENAWSAPWILIAYHLMGTKPGASAAMNEQQLARVIIDSQTKKGWFGGEYASIQTTAQGVIALEGISLASKAQAKGVKAILAAQNKNGGFYDGTEFTGGTASNIDTTGECMAALYGYSKSKGSYAVATALSAAAQFLVKQANFTLDGYSKNTASDELMTSASAFVGLAAMQSATNLKFGISKANVSKVSKKRYTGKAIKPKVTVKYDSKTLKQGVDYQLSYAKNTKVGTAHVIVKGKGNFTGSKTVKFKIVKK